MARPIRYGDRITVHMLRLMRACDEQVAQFAAEWPDGCALDETNIRRAAAIGLNVGWFACAALSAPALATYDAAVAPAGKTHEAATAPAWATYDEATTEALIAALKAEASNG